MVSTHQEPGQLIGMAAIGRRVPRTGRAAIGPCLPLGFLPQRSDAFLLRAAASPMAASTSNANRGRVAAAKQNATRSADRPDVSFRVDRRREFHR